LGAKQFLEIEVVQQWESTFEGVTDLAWSDSDDAELAALRAEVERLRAAAQRALPPGRAPEDNRSTGPPKGVVPDPGEAQISTGSVAIASGCAGTGRGRPARLAKSAEVGRRPCCPIGRARKGLCCLGRRLLASNRILQ
jgi:hypothetical protein